MVILCGYDECENSYMFEIINFLLARKGYSSYLTQIQAAQYLWVWVRD